MVDALVARGGAATRLQAGADEGLQLQHETVRLVHEELKLRGAEIDVKLLRAGNEAANNLVRLAVHVAEAEFRGRRDDELTELIALLAREKAKG